MTWSSCFTVHIFLLVSLRSMNVDLACYINLNTTEIHITNKHLTYGVNVWLLTQSCCFGLFWGLLLVPLLFPPDFKRKKKRKKKKKKKKRIKGQLHISETETKQNKTKQNKKTQPKQTSVQTSLKWDSCPKYITNPTPCTKATNVEGEVREGGGEVGGLGGIRYSSMLLGHWATNKQIYLSIASHAVVSADQSLR